MIITICHIDIARPAAETFAFMTDPDRATFWHTGVLEFKAEPGMPVGSHGHLVMTVMGQKMTTTFTILENDGKTITRARSNQGPIRYETTQTVGSLSRKSCRVSVRTTIDAGFVFKLAEPALESIANLYLDADLQTLKATLEAATT